MTTAIKTAPRTKEAMPRPNWCATFIPTSITPATKTVHEHFAINANGTSPFASYVVHAEAKRRGYREAQIDFFETTSAQAAERTLLAALKSELERREIPLLQRPPDEIQKAVNPLVVKHYHQLIGTCIKHIRSSQLTLDMLFERAKSLHDKERARIFARVIWLITEAYSKKLTDAGRIDFDSMIGDATRLVETRRYVSPYSLVLVDEFQDISEPRANLIKALRQQNPFAQGIRGRRRLAVDLSLRRFRHLNLYPLPGEFRRQLAGQAGTDLSLQPADR
jgi:DNA helicase-4